MTAPAPDLFEVRRILITGGAGFIGAAFARFALAQPGVEEVVVLDNFTYAGRWERLALVLYENPIHGMRHYRLEDGMCVIQESIGSHRVETILREFKVDTVVNFAAESHVDRSITGSAPFLQTNVLGVANLLEACRNFWQKRKDVRFHQVSTDEVWGDRNGLSAATPETRYNPSSPYAASKAAADHLVSAWARTYDLPCSTTWGTNTYGPGQLAEKLIPLALSKLMAGENVPVYGDGQQVRDWMFVDDHVRGVWAALNARPGSWILGTGLGTTNNKLLHKIIEKLAFITNFESHDYERQFTQVADRLGHDRRYAVKVTADNASPPGWAAEVGLSDGLNQTIDWYIDHPKWRIVPELT